MDIEHAKAAGRVAREYKGGPSGLLEEVRMATRMVVRDVLAEHSGMLLVEVSEEGASIQVDGRIVGVSPHPSFSVGGGFHTLEVDKKGFIVFRKDVRVEPKQLTREPVTLKPSQEYLNAYREQAELERTLAWTGLGVGAAGLVTGVALLVVGQAQGNELRDDIQAYNNATVKDNDTYARLVSRKSSLAALNVATLVSALVGLGAGGLGVYWYLTGDDPGRYKAHVSSNGQSGRVDWHHLAGEPSSPRRDVLMKRIGMVFFCSALACNEPFLFSLPALQSPDPAACGPDANPMALQARVYPERVVLQWESNATNADGYLIERRATGEGNAEVGRSTGNDVTSYPDTTTARDNIYNYRVTGIRGACLSLPSNELTVYTLPLAPTAFALQSEIDGSITLTWTDTSSNEKGFTIERRAGESGDYVILTQEIAADAEEHTDTAADYDTRYFYRVYSRSQREDLSEPANADIWARPNAPGTLVVTAASMSSLEISWTDTNSQESGYRVERSSNEDSYSVIATLPADSTLFLDTGLEDTTWYEYRVFATNPAGDSGAATGGGRPLLAPQISWGQGPSLTGCALTIPGVVSGYDENATFAQADGSVERVVSGAVTATSTGLSATVDILQPGAFLTSWTIGDSLGSSTTLNRHLSLGFSHADLFGARVGPTASLHEDVMDGRQVYYPSNENLSPAGCSVCAGKRGSVSAGTNHACILTSAGEVHCWGLGDGGALGNGLETSVATYPEPVCESGAGASCVPLSNAVAVVAGGEMGCALKADTTLQCWGSASNGGYLGDGASWGVRLNPVPVIDDVTGDPLHGVVAVDVGDAHGCALLDTSHVKCWGYNAAGAVGDGTTTNRAAAVTVCEVAAAPTASCTCGSGGSCGPLTNIVGVAVGSSHSCALHESGTVYCWGHNSGGAALGCGETYTGMTHTTNPVPVCASGSVLQANCVPLSGARDISAGPSHTCIAEAIDGASGRIKCWGDHNAFAPALAGGQTPVKNPVTLCNTGTGSPNCAAGTATEGVVAISAGGQQTCMVMADGTLRCVGFLFALSYPANPKPVCATGNKEMSCAPALNGFVGVAAGRDYVCALGSTGAITCLGQNESGQLGNGLTESFDSTEPGPVCLSGAGAACAAGEPFADSALRGCGDLVVSLP